MLRLLYFFIFPMLLVYPNGLLANTYVNYIYIVFVYFSFLLFDKKKRIRFTITNKFFLALFCITFIANLCSSLIKHDIDFFDYLSSSLRYFTYFLISTIMVCTVSNATDFKFWVKSFLFGFFLSLIILFLDSFHVFWIDPIFKIISFEELDTLDIYFRAYGAYLSPISAGLFILNTFFLTISLLVTNYITDIKEKLILWLLTILSVIGIVMTASRTSLVALVASVVFIVLISKSRMKFIFISFLALVVIYQSGILETYIENITVRSEIETSGGKSALEGSGRVDTVLNSIRLFFNERTFFFGVGPSEYVLGDGVYSLAHNGFLSVVFCYGLMGVVLFFRIGRTLYKIVFKNKSHVNNNRHKFIKLYIGLFILGNFIAFISSDGPVAHFWLVSFIFFLFFVQNYYEINVKNANY